MFKLVLQKAEELEIKFPTSAGSWKKQEFQKNIYFCFTDYAKIFDCVCVPNLCCVDHKNLWKILEEMGIPDNLTCLLRNLYAVQKQPFEPVIKEQTVCKSGKEYVKAVYCHPAYVSFKQSTSS